MKRLLYGSLCHRSDVANNLKAALQFMLLVVLMAIDLR